MKILTLCILACLPYSSAAGQNHSVAWYSFTDKKNKTLYITEIQQIDTGKNGEWTRDHFQAGFLESRKWKNRNIHEFYSQLEFKSRGFEDLCISKREKLINRSKEFGFSIVPIAMPAPLQVKYKPGGKVSRQ